MNKIKLLFVSILVAIAGTAAARSWNVGIEAGYVHNDYHTGMAGVGTEGKNGYMVGADVRWFPIGGLSLSTGVEFNRLGGTLDFSKFNNTFTTVDYGQFNYLRFPIRIGYKINLPFQLSIYPEVGGYLGTGVGGYAYLTEGQTVVRLNDIFTDTASAGTGISIPYKGASRFDGGLQFNLTLGWSRYFIKAGYGLGLHSIGYGQAHNRTVSISIGANLFN